MRVELFVLAGLALACWIVAAWATLRADARAEVQYLIERGCTCLEPREGRHRLSCPLYTDATDEAGA